MKIALIGASGQAGSRILAELSSRGHIVTAIARDPSKVDTLPNVTAAAGDIDVPDALANVLAGHDAVISSVHFSAANPDKLIGAVKASGVRRYYVVGGAGSLEVAPGVLLVNTPEFPAMYKAEAQGGVDYLKQLKAEDGLDWTFLSPSAAFVPGERTGNFRLGKDRLLANENGSSISFEDFAVALVNEIEAPTHVKQRFTVGY
ncbi:MULTISPECIES: NAD(P)-dependent oxidoreductase [unclassified Rhizobium]|uniref:NAD(P)-dependent oxidoreductase n=1 Tax=unclassified Rhizobium TaxID=2613769 RepID=UPI000CDF3AEA|nr:MULTISPECIES: NAD(P)-dependent oxidoreductase [Rhizobium]AVA22218.1 NAD(P)-binding domain-containing protein [Rhizobium sp. NXC24]MDK4738056.1 NAD(P)-dependent oxidoreductase [Rhizobium sp. CNPSo 3464]UWU19665.1 NAD(P)-dependent oxidoreductase [Rhizobium tropici]